MKKILTLSLLCLICYITFGQKKDINLNEIAKTAQKMASSYKEPGK